MSNEQNREKWGLLIGIDRYPYVPPLQGCINDIEAIASVLTRNFGFPAANLSMLRDAQATRRGIQDALEALLQRVRTDDIVVVHYSGHGSRIPDREGDKPSGMDETIVPYDSGRGEGRANLDITDDELFLWLLELTAVTRNVTLVFDCCHSGTIVRDSYGCAVRWVEPDRRPIGALPPSPIRPEDLPRLRARAPRQVGASGWSPPGDRYVLLAACRDDELACEYLDRQAATASSYGAFTYFLVQALSAAEAGATYRDIFERVRVRLTGWLPAQHPQLEGTIDRALFGVTDIATPRFVPVLERNGQSVMLAIGAAHGASAGSWWSVYPEAAKDLADPTQRIGMVEIVSVGAARSEGVVREESPHGSIRESSRMVETRHRFGEMRLAVDFRPPTSPAYGETAGRFAEALGQSSLLRLADSAERSDLRVYLVPKPDDRRAEPDLPELRAASRAVWAVVGPDGQLAMPICDIDAPDVLGTVLGNLERYARYRFALELSNPDPASDLKDKIDLKLLKRRTDGAWTYAEPEFDGAEIVYCENEPIAFEIVSRHCEPVYIGVLDFGQNGLVDLLYPPAHGAIERLAPHQHFHFGTRIGQHILLRLPERPFPPPRPDDPKAYRTNETFKLFATTQPADYSILSQAGYRGSSLPERDCDSTLVGALLRLALTGAGERNAIVLSAADDWTTVGRTVVLERPKNRIANAWSAP